MFQRGWNHQPGSHCGKICFSPTPLVKGVQWHCPQRRPHNKNSRSWCSFSKDQRQRPKRFLEKTLCKLLFCFGFLMIIYIYIHHYLTICIYIYVYIDSYFFSCPEMLFFLQSIHCDFCVPIIACFAPRQRQSCRSPLQFTTYRGDPWPLQAV